MPVMLTNKFLSRRSPWAISIAAITFLTAAIAVALEFVGIGGAAMGDAVLLF
jgi:hypothetical protein